MHPIETSVCCDHASPTGECGRWKCGHPHVGLLSDRGAPGGKKDGVRPEDGRVGAKTGRAGRRKSASGVAASSAHIRLAPGLPRCLKPGGEPGALQARLPRPLKAVLQKGTTKGAAIGNEYTEEVNDPYHTKWREGG